MGAQRVLALTNRRAYADLAQGQGTQIDIAISPAQTVIGELLAHVRRSDVAAVCRLRRGALATRRFRRELQLRDGFVLVVLIWLTSRPGSAPSRGRWAGWNRCRSWCRSRRSSGQRDVTPEAPAARRSRFRGGRLRRLPSLRRTVALCFDQRTVPAVDAPDHRILHRQCSCAVEPPF